MSVNDILNQGLIPQVWNLLTSRKEKAGGAKIFNEWRFNTRPKGKHRRTPEDLKRRKEKKNAPNKPGKTTNQNSTRSYAGGHTKPASQGNGPLLKWLRKQTSGIFGADPVGDADLQQILNWLQYTGQ